MQDLKSADNATCGKEETTVDYKGQMCKLSLIAVRFSMLYQFRIQIILWETWHKAYDKRTQSSFHQMVCGMCSENHKTRGEENVMGNLEDKVSGFLFKYRMTP